MKVERIKCAVVFQEDWSWGFPKGSPYFNIFNHQLKKMKETGVINNIFKREVISFLCS